MPSTFKCPDCGGWIDDESKSKSHCRKCLDKKRAFFAARVAAGVCRACGKAPPEPGRRQCGPCLKREADRRKAYRAERAAAGLCRAAGCNRPPAPGDGQYCETHREMIRTYQREFRRRYRANQRETA
jgi:hypothetical protein